MGTLLPSSQITPQNPKRESSAMSLLPEQVSRSSFKFLSKIGTSGPYQQSIWWLAALVKCPQQMFYVRQTSKIKVYNHKRVESVLEQMQLLTQSTNKNIVKVYAAFQDNQYLYLVTQALDSVTFETLLEEHTFSEEQTRYVVSALLDIISYIHDKGFAITELSPSNIHFDKRNGSLKLMEIINPAKIDESCRSSIVETVCHYSAPEILYRGRVLAECDFYSVGIIMYEMMTQERLFNGKLDRHTLLSENIQVQKSKIPEEWEPEAADFLIKMLVKNPSLRLGRYGCYQVKNHPWLKDFDLQDHFRSKLDISSDQQSEIKQIKSKNSKDSKQFSNQLSDQLLKQFYFQQAFVDYHYRLDEKKTVREQQQSHWGKDSIFISNSQELIEKSSLQ